MIMSLIKTLSEQDILKGIDAIEKNPTLLKGRLSTTYDLVYNGKIYPPILVLSEANKNAGGEGLDLGSFNNSTPKAFKILTDLGFEVVKKEESFYEDLVEFIRVADLQKTGLGTTIEAKDYNSIRKHEYKNLKVDVSFGIGRATVIPWISFLEKGQTTSNGIYPVYLYYKQHKILILAYGISETTAPKVNWNIDKSKSIESYFSLNNLGSPDRYGGSFVFKVYKANELLDKSTINNDLENLISIYKSILSKSESIISSTLKSKSMKLQIPFDYKIFNTDNNNAGLIFNDQLITRFISSLLTKPFVILTGLSGSGKTKLAQAFAMWICESEKQYKIVPVGSDWTNREPLLGFPNALKDTEYIKPDNGVLELIIEAEKDAANPYFLILDEMNLSHVERYFADFLSVMESSQKISLHAGTEVWSDVPATISLPKNLFIIGTVNIDETTYMFSPKVLDRASVIEFRVTKDEMDNYLDSTTALNLDILVGKGSGMGASFVELATSEHIPAEPAELKEALVKFFDELKKTGAEFGYRSASEIRRFAGVVNKIEPAWQTSEILDAAIMQKLLPKLHGSRNKLSKVLITLGCLCLKDSTDAKKKYFDTLDINIETDANIIYKTSFEKIMRMYKNALDNGYTSYAEA